MKKYYLLLFALFILGCTPPSKTTTAEKFASVLEDYYQDGLALYRINATYEGDVRYNDTLPNFLSPDFKAKEAAYFNTYKTAINAFDDKSLSAEDQLSKKILNWELDLSIEGLQLKKELMPVDQMWTFQLSIGQLASGQSAQPFKTVKDYENWLIRLDGYLEWMQSAETKMREGIAEQWVLPKALVKKVLPQLKTMTQPQLEENLFYSPIMHFPEDFSSEDKERLTNAYAHKITEQLIPAYQQLHDFMAGPYMEAARETSGFNSLPGGEAYYAHAIKYYTTTTLSADAIHQLGLSEVARIQSEMEKVKTEVGFEGSLKDFFDHVRNLKSLMPFDAPQQVIDHFKDIHTAMKPQVDQLFSLQPKTAFEIRRTEAFRESSASAEYNSGSMDGTRPGIFYVPIPDVNSYNIFSDESLFLHEAIPGHHFQISLQQENTGLPSFRKGLWYSAYGEGWALYAESLGKELGLFTDPYQYFGMLGAEIHRAVRLVVDTGLHAKGWTREQAIQYSLDNEAESEAAIESEIERYMANPGQALSYKIGQLKIRELRNKATQALGNQFDVRVFHQKVLESGCLPLAFLEDKIDHWIHDHK